ncbi:uncharacterized protein LOC125020156 [Mugil cephalus]|uniref:uncharacterized protein LOC125020156 n=1 Tax=Mugil cephalus TaxID=48193 RepID=UPI001FB63523|nr:uncharacterized protein LOC125020156 [Mugil cephalus]XP_047461402.1 uncharacterized protein LOC125020156 [Mugil cephalus]
MSGPGGLSTDLTEDVAAAAPTAEPQVDAVLSKKPEEENSEETSEDEEEEVEEKDEEEDEEEEEEMSKSAHLEPSTLPWPGDKRPPREHDKAAWSDQDVSEADERDTGISADGQDLSEEQSQAESDRKGKAKWRESMPEGERWREDEIKEHRHDGGDGSLADDEEEEEDEEEEDEEEEEEWRKMEKSGLGFTPNVMILSPSGREAPEERRPFIEKEVEREPYMEPDSAVQIYSDWGQEDDKMYMCEHLCGERVRLVLATVAAGLLFPLLVWGGYVLLPFDSPVLESSPLRVLYTLRCSFFAVIPVMLGVVVQGLARLRHGAVKPLYQTKLLHREVAVHWHYINESLALFLFYFLQLAVMSTYISQDLVKLVPLLTIVFVFGRLIYWLCLSLGSTIRAFGFGFSFFPILAMLGTNLYYVCVSIGPDSVFDVAPPTVAPPPRQRWWG